MMGWTLLVAGLVFALLAWIVLHGAGRRWQESGLPRVRVAYVDERDWKRPDAVLRSYRYRLVGRPDYLLERRGRQIPVEVKPTRTAAQPYPGDVMQLAAYGLLIEETTGKAPPYGLLRYRDATFEVPFDRRLYEQLLDLLREMDRARRAADVPRSHADAARCRACGVRDACGGWAL